MPTGKQLKSWLKENYPETTAMDGYDDCIIGICHRHTMEPIIAYDKAKVLKALMKDGMTYDEAVEFHDFNQGCAWVGDTTPCFIEIPEIEVPIKRKKKSRS